MSQFNQIVEVQFHGDRLQAVQDERGVWVSVRRVCECLGLDMKSQHAKLSRKGWATMVIITTVAEDHKQRQLAMLHLDCLPMWLATIESSRVKEEVRFKLELYQRECVRVLAEHFFGRAQQTQQQFLTAEQAVQLIAGALQNILPQVLAPINETLRQHAVILDRLTNQTEQRRLGDSIEARYRIRQMWPESTNSQRKTVCDQTVARIRELGGPIRSQYGRILIERDYLHILDGVIDLVRSMSAERGRMPLYDRNAN